MTYPAPKHDEKWLAKVRAEQSDVPRAAEYVVLSDRCVHGKKGEKVRLELHAGEAQALIEGGHLRPVK